MTDKQYTLHERFLSITTIELEYRIYNPNVM